MNGKAFFDTNVLIYAALENDPRSERAEELLAAGRDQRAGAEMSLFRSRAASSRRPGMM